MRTRSISIGMVTISLAFLIGCSSIQYTYVPSELSGLPAERAHKGRAFYLIPANAPTGNIRIASGGLVRVRPESTGPRVRAVHIRIVLSNQSSATPWTLIPTDLSVSFPNQSAAVHPLQGKTNLPTSVSVAKGELRSLDLYFLLPVSTQSASDLPEFDFHWTVNIGAFAVVQTTSFDRQELPEYDVPPYSFYSPFWGDGFDGGPWGWGGGNFVE